MVNQEYELATHFTAYEDASVKYLLAPTFTRALATTDGPGRT